MKRRFLRNRLMLMMAAGTLVFSSVKLSAMAMEDGELPAIEYSGEGEDHVYTAPTNIRWDDEVPGRALFEVTDPTEGVLIVRLYKDGSQAGGGTIKCEGAKAYSFNFSNRFIESGTYTFKVKQTSYKPDYDMDTGAVSEESPDFVYVQPTETIGIVSNPHWSADKSGVAEWDAVEHAYGYQVNMVVVGKNHGSIKNVDSPATSVDFSDVIEKYPGEGFRFYVYAWSSDITKWANTTTASELSEEYRSGDDVRSGKCGENLTWDLSEEGTVLTISGSGEMYDFLNGQLPPWSEGGSYGNPSIKTVILPEGLKNIGGDAFCECTGLTSISIPNSVTSIGLSAFSGCTGLTSISIPDSVTSICDHTFMSCSGLTNLTIPSSVESIGECAFNNCRLLANVTMPSSVKSIGQSAFCGCNITDVYYGGTKAQWEAIVISDENDPLKDATIHYTNSEDDTGVKGFVTRLYRVGLNRTPEEEGLNNWSNQLTSGEANAVDVVKGVLCSPEYLGKGKTNGQMVTDCYNAMLGRDPDNAGYNSWVDGLNSGMSINAIFAGFVGSQEFATLCSQYEIKPGTYELTEERDKNAGVTKFVGRLYTEALGRSYDIDGLNNWCGQINANPSRDNILNVATNGFFHSQEFLNKNLSNTDFVKVCYRTFLGRDYDDAGLAGWVGQLDRGEKTRDQVMEGFAYSQEFTNIMASYGL